MTSGAAPIRAERIALFGLDGERVATVTMVTDDRPPTVVMFEGEPFLLDCSISRLMSAEVALSYVQARAYRADCMVVEDFR